VLKIGANDRERLGMREMSWGGKYHHKLGKTLNFGV
jgi:hypothetical protein